MKSPDSGNQFHWTSPRSSSVYGKIISTCSCRVRQSNDDSLRKFGFKSMKPWHSYILNVFKMTGCVIKLQEFKFRLNANFTTYALTEWMKIMSADWPYIFRCFVKAWFSLAHKYKHKHIRTSRMAYLTQFSIPLSFLQLGDKQDGGRFVCHIAFDMFAWGLGQSGLWLVHGLVLMLVLMSTPFSLVKATT